MAEETLDETQTLQTGEGESQETESSTTESDVDVETLKEQNRQLYERAKKAEAKAKQLEGKPKAASTETNILRDNPSIPDERFDRLELKTEGYSSDEVETIMELGGKSALENPIVKKAIEVMRKEAKSKEATPSGTAKSPIYQKYSEKDLKTMPLEELEKIVPQEN